MELWEFNVDVSGYKIGDYFGDEEDFISGAIKDVFGNKEKGRKALTVTPPKNRTI